MEVGIIFNHLKKHFFEQIIPTKDEKILVIIYSFYLNLIKVIILLIKIERL